MTADDTSREALIERVRELQRSVRELQAARDTYREHWRRLMRDYEAVFKERDELEAECLRVDEANTRLGEQVRQRDVVIERVRALADEWSRRGAASGPFPDRVVLDVDTEVLGPLRAALEGGGR